MEKSAIRGFPSGRSARRAPSHWASRSVPRPATPKVQTALAVMRPHQSKGTFELIEQNAVSGFERGADPRRPDLEVAESGTNQPSTNMVDIEAEIPDEFSKYTFTVDDGVPESNGSIARRNCTRERVPRGKPIGRSSLPKVRPGVSTQPRNRGSKLFY